MRASVQILLTPRKLNITLILREMMDIHAIQRCLIHAWVEYVGAAFVGIADHPRSLFMAAHVPRTWSGESSPYADAPISASRSPTVDLYVSQATTCSRTHSAMNCGSVR